MKARLSADILQVKGFEGGAFALSLGFHLFFILGFAGFIGLRGIPLNKARTMDINLVKETSATRHVSLKRSPAARPPGASVEGKVQPQVDPIPVPGLVPAAAVPETAALPETQSEEPGIAEERGRVLYMGESYVYIRERIQHNLIYPVAARKMGWTGQAVVSFAIEENGNATYIALVKSSGFDILDRSALDAVRRGSPYPKPPSRTQFTMPVSYQLN